MPPNTSGGNDKNDTRKLQHLKENIFKYTLTHYVSYGGLSIRTANLIFKSESWLFFGTIIRCNSADLELLEVGQTISPVDKEHICRHNIEFLRSRIQSFLHFSAIQKVSVTPKCSFDKPFHSTTANGFQYRRCLFF